MVQDSCHTFVLWFTPEENAVPCLLVFTKTAVFFILPKKALSHSPWVSGVREQDMTMKSLSDTRVSIGTGERKREWGRGHIKKKQKTFFNP